MDWADEGRLVARAVSEMREQGVPVSPRGVEHVVNTATRPGEPRAGSTVSAAQLAGAYLTPKHLDGSGGELLGVPLPEPAGNATRAGDTVSPCAIAGAYLTPKHADGSGGELLGTLRAGNATRPQFAEPVPYFEARAEREQLQQEAAGLHVLIDRPATPEHVREDARLKLAKINARLDAIRAARQPETQLDRSGRRMA